MDFHIKYHKVGFGLFSSGQIGNFKFVYDCGSKSKNLVNRCITKSKEFNKDDKIDLLAISHFHRDHINGIKKLLESVNHVDTIILPYLTPMERLKHLVYLEMEAVESDSKSRPTDQWLRLFIADPSKTLLDSFDKKIKNIIFLNGGADKYDGENIRDPESVQSNEYNEFNFDINNLEPSLEQEGIKSSEGIKDSKVSIRKHGCVPLTSNKIRIWNFIFYYCKQSEKVDGYIEKIRKDCGIKTDIITKEDLSKIINQIKLPAIAKGAKLTNSDINNTSLLLLHYPVKKYKVFFNNRYNRIQLNSYYFEKYKIDCNGYFYTGDINLKEKVAEISNYYDRLIDQISVFQVPHHGSKDNWDAAISRKNPKMIHIISSKLKNTKKLHPSSDVLYEITEHQGVILWCNDNNEINLEGFLYFIV